MTVRIETWAILAPFSARNFQELLENISKTPPSIVEYYLNDLLNSSQNVDFINKRNVRETIYIEDFQIYFCYDDEFYLYREKSFDEFYEDSFF